MKLTFNSDKKNKLHTNIQVYNNYKETNIMCDEQYNLSDIFSDLNSESSVILPKSIKIKNIKSLDTISNTTSSFMPQKESYSDATSSFMPQKGGYFNDTKNNDINQLISMLSATSESYYTTNSTDTEQLKNKLFNILGGGKDDDDDDDPLI
jgi:hypothetical protein